MMRRYSVFLREEMLSQMPRSSRSREAIMRFIRSLAEDPFQRGDYQDVDEIGHELQVKIIADRAITFWTDHAASEVKVLSLQLADRF